MIRSTCIFFSLFHYQKTQTRKSSIMERLAGDDPAFGKMPRNLKISYPLKKILLIEPFLVAIFDHHVCFCNTRLTFVCLHAQFRRTQSRLHAMCNSNWSRQKDRQSTQKDLKPINCPERQSLVNDNPTSSCLYLEDHTETSFFYSQRRWTSTCLFVPTD